MKAYFKNDSLNQLADAVRRSGRSMKKEFATAVNATARSMKTPISQEIRKTLAAPAKTVKEVVGVTRKASAGSLVATVSVRRASRLSLKEFGAKQTKRGVTARVLRGKKDLFAGGFMGPKPGVIAAKLRGHAFIRKDISNSRSKIRKLWGLSPYKVYVHNNMAKPLAKEAESRLKKQIERRIQYNIFRANQLT